MKYDVLVTSLRDDQAVLDVVSGEVGILYGLQQQLQQQPNRIHIGTSTISPAVSTSLAEAHTAHGCSYLAAPVLGNPSVAKLAKLTTFVAGDSKDIERCNRLFNAYCQKIINIGNEHPSANTLKLIANYVLLALIDLMGQVYALGEKTNIDLHL
jgi:3-hydroxyisobutyrate dehydrogenase-like beta-hydroxyacid dehydrogenase